MSSNDAAIAMIGEKQPFSDRIAEKGLEPPAVGSSAAPDAIASV
jgi:hypothetical protein